MTKVVRKTLPNFPENQEVSLMSCFVTSAVGAKCTECNGSKFETVYDRRLKSKIPICASCEGDPSMYRVGYTINTLKGSEKIYRTKNNLGEKLNDPFKATAYLNYVREKIAEEGAAFDVRSVGTNKARKELLISNCHKDYIEMREVDLEYGAITPRGMSKIESNFRLYIVPLFGEWELKKISYMSVRNALDKARMHKDRRRRLTMAQKKEIVGVLNPFLKYASRMGLINGVPELPKYTVESSNTELKDLYNFKEVKLILDNVDKRDAQIALSIISIYARRKGEVEDLKWKDFDFDKGLITFARHASDGKKYGKKVLDGLKASPGKTLTFDFFPGLRNMLAEIEPEVLKKDPNLDWEEKVFANSGLKGKGFGKNYLYDQWSTAVKKLMKKRGRNGKPLISKYCGVHKGCRNSVLTSYTNEGASTEFLEAIYGGDRRTLEKHYIRRRKQNTSSFQLGATLVQLPPEAKTNANDYSKIA